MSILIDRQKTFDMNEEQEGNNTQDMLIDMREQKYAPVIRFLDEMNLF